MTFCRLIWGFYLLRILIICFIVSKKDLVLNKWNLFTYQRTLIFLKFDFEFNFDIRISFFVSVVFFFTYVLIQNFCSFVFIHFSYSFILSVVKFLLRTYLRKNLIFRSHNFFVTRCHYSTDLVSNDSINLILFWPLVEVYAPFII